MDVIVWDAGKLCTPGREMPVQTGLQGGCHFKEENIQ